MRIVTVIKTMGRGMEEEDLVTNAVRCTLGTRKQKGTKLGEEGDYVSPCELKL